MAQRVGYYDNHVLMTEGPFVIVNAHGWRIEVDRVRVRCPGLVADSVYNIFKTHNFPGKVADQDEAARMCDHLNQLVRAGLIIYDEVSDAWEPVAGWATHGPQATAPSWVTFQRRMNAIAAARGVPMPFAGVT